MDKNTDVTRQHSGTGAIPGSRTTTYTGTDPNAATGLPQLEKYLYERNNAEALAVGFSEDPAIRESILKRHVKCLARKLDHGKDWQ
ncbi:MAG: hypothetical protein M1820_001733 [Bogoriella megaspora]|nr:MAG: hypothetical protein M1820_001733 [Bogoriella megaspora]